MMRSVITYSKNQYTFVRKNLHLDIEQLQAYIQSFYVENVFVVYCTCFCCHTLFYSTVICYVTLSDAAVLLNYVKDPR
jgi:hypothetical protein